MKTQIVLSVIVLFWLAAAVFAQKQSAAEVVQEFYNAYNATDKTFNRAGVNARKKWLTENLYRLFVEELRREEEFLKKNPTDKPHYGDGFPLHPLEECAVGKNSYPNIFRVQAADVAADAATVEVKFYKPQQCGGGYLTSYRVKLVKSGSKWLIDDFVFDDGTTLRADLTRKDY